MKRLALGVALLVLILLGSVRPSLAGSVVVDPWGTDLISERSEPCQ